MILSYWIFSTPPLQFLHHILIMQSCGLRSVLPQISQLCGTWASSCLCLTCHVMELGRGYGAAPGSPNGFSCSSKHLYVECSSWLSLGLLPHHVKLHVWQNLSQKPLMGSLSLGAAFGSDCANERSVSTALKLCALDPLSVETSTVFLCKISVWLFEFSTIIHCWLLCHCT